jgi:hypothetical protein
VHGVFAQHVDAEFLAGLREAEEGVESQNVSKDASTLIVMNEF